MTRYCGSWAALPRAASTFHSRFLVWCTAGLLVLLAVGRPGNAAAQDQTGALPRPAEEGRPIKVLFLGHPSEHHNSAAYFPLLATPLARKGIQLTYEDDPSEALVPQRLRHYDALIIYANHEAITPDQEQALLDFVASGKGFIPIHSASYTFLNSDPYIELVGAQFSTHGAGEFTAEVVQADHPAIQDVEPFTTWDETYVHHRHNPDRVVLMERVDESGREPYTWVRTHGAGRVFYTAYGHDERTWDNPGFQKLVEQGILWAVGDDVRAVWERLEMPELTYVDAKLPNYEQRDPPPKMQLPLSVEDSQKLISVPAEFRLELFAAEPDIVNPMTMAFDERGRLWIVETVDYPNEVRAGEGGDDRIKILEDTDGDGRADKFTVFADSLNIPTSLTFANDGVIVAQAPNFLFLKDTDGDDRADVREVLLTGWGTFDTHAGPSNLQYGPDNYIWGSVGYAGFEGTVDGEPLEFSQGFFRMRPDGSGFEYLTRTSNNTWGLGFSESFDVFGSTANNAPSWYMAIPNQRLEGLKGIARPIGSEGIADFYAMHPLTPNVRQVDVFGGYTAAAGHYLYTARAFPQEYWNRAALINEPTGKLLGLGFVEKQGAGFVTKDGWTLLASADEWVAPVHAQVGPDGAVWVLDWYDFIVQHNPTPEGFDTGEGNAYVTDLRDKQRGRIYRVVYEDAPPYTPVSLSKDDTRGLLEALRSDNMLWRLTAQRLLVERGETDVVPVLIELTRDTSIDAVGVNGGAFHALWTLHGLGQLDGSNDAALQAAIQALRHPASGVRKAAAQVLPRTEASRSALLEAGLLSDPDLHTRLAAVVAMSEMPASEEVGKLLYEMSRDEDVYADQWLSRAVYAAASTHTDGFLGTYEADPDKMDVGALSAELRLSDERPSWEMLGQQEITALPTMSLPGRWDDQGLADLDGYVWYMTVVEGTAAGDAVLHLGAIDDNDETWVNGVLVGATRGYDEMRTYTVPASAWRQGQNVIAVRVHDTSGGGGFHGEPDSMRVAEAGGQSRSLAGAWHYRVERNTRSRETGYAQAGELAAHFAYHYGGFQTAQNEGSERAKPDKVVTLRAVRQQLAYDLTEFSVAPGTLVELVFINDDLMQHNVVLGRQGSLERIGEASDDLATRPSGAPQHYVPAIQEVITATPLVDPGQTVRLQFTAPTEPGSYPYVCTFPGHWRVMNGVMQVTPEAGASAE